MARQKILSLRLDPELVARADALVERLERDPVLAAASGNVSRSTVLRLALVRGLRELEREYPAET